ncbi:MAG TPA: hypothetical protein VD835_00350, partial [Pyrinomonadaceae bacterium]|nr:hypothetical protein [Pyrinomonadaceae bacterium]
MNSAQLKRWKEREAIRAKELSEGVAGGSPEFSLKDFYPEFELVGPYTTSLEPYCPIWALVPFFRKVVVGINPYLKDEAAFSNWYGISPRQLLWLQEMGRVEIKVTFPRSANTVPSYLNTFFTGRFPSTIRDHEYTHRLLGEEK